MRVNWLLTEFSVVIVLIRAHFLIDAVILQHVIPASTFTDNELSLMKTIILDCSKNHVGIGSKDIPMAKRFRSKISVIMVFVSLYG